MVIYQFSTLMFIVYFIFMVRSYRNILIKRFSSRYFDIIFVVADFALWYLAMALPTSSFRAIGIVALMCVNILVYYKTSILVGLHIGGVYHMILYCTRGAMFSILSIVFGVEFQSLLLNRDLYYGIHILAVFVSMFVITMYRKYSVGEERIKHLFKFKKQLRFFVVYLYSIIAFMLLVNNGRVLGISGKWFSILYLVAAVLCITLLVFIYEHLISITEYVEKEMIEQTIIDGLEAKLNFYHALESQVNSLRKFRHDYQKTLKTLYYYIDQKDLESMKSYLDDTTTVVYAPILNEVQYSNHTLLDAMLQNAAQRAQQMNTQFDAIVSIPLELEISDFDIVRIFSNLVENAISATTNLDDGYIKLVGKQNNQWFHVEISNNYSGKIIREGNTIKTTKDDSTLHGHGIRIVEDVVTGLDGVFSVVEDEVNHVFTVKFSIPIQKLN